jgi:hypothetical protein
VPGDRHPYRDSLVGPQRGRFGPSLVLHTPLDRLLLGQRPSDIGEDQPIFRLSRNYRDGPQERGEREHGPGEMSAAQVHGGRCDGPLHSGTAARARHARPRDPEDRAGGLAHPRRKPPCRDPCRRCGRESRALHGWDAGVRFRPLPLFDVPVCVESRPTRSQGPSCAGHPTTTPRGVGYEGRSPHTPAYEPWALRRLINSTVADAARTLGVSEERSAGLLDRWSVCEVDGGAWEGLGGSAARQSRASAGTAMSCG